MQAQNYEQNKCRDVALLRISTCSPRNTWQLIPMSWEFSSLWIINRGYVSSYNDSLYTTPEIIEIDDCGPSNLISANHTLWLVLVHAVACVIQLPGSLFLFRQSNFYRFSPELGIVDTLAVLSLLLTAFWRGYCWNESIATVFAAEDGLWWRANLEALSHPDGALETRGR